MDNSNNDNNNINTSNINKPLNRNNNLNKSNNNVKKPRRYFVSNEDVMGTNNIQDSMNEFPKKDELKKDNDLENSNVYNERKIHDNNELDYINNNSNITRPRRNSFNLLNNNKVNQKIDNFNKNNRPKVKEKEESNNQDNNIKNNNLKNDNNVNKVQNSNNNNQSKRNNNVKKDGAKKALTNTKVGKAFDVAKKIGVAKNIADNATQVENEVNENANQLKEQAKKQIIKIRRQKIYQAILKVLLPILPYIIGFLIIASIIIVILAAILVWFNDEDRYMDTFEVNYCSNVNLKWEETNIYGEIEEKEVTISSDQYIAYLMSQSEFKELDNVELLNALSVIYRTNFYANSGNLDSDTCYYHLDVEYSDPMESMVNAVKETDNKIFAYNDNEIKELPIDSNFTYIREDNFDSKESAYVLYQDKVKYPKEYVDSHVDGHISNDTSSKEVRSFPPFAALYFADEKKNTWQELLYHYLAPGSFDTLIRNVTKIGGSDWYNYGFGGSGGLCSDIPLATTSLSKEEFVNYVKSNVSNSVFVNNAEKIYDISIQNNFNPEMVVIRAILEGFSPGGNTNNYWGIGCTNSGGLKACYTYSSFDLGVLGYINTVKKINQPTLFGLQRKYSYIGSNWFNPGSPSGGGCYYFPYIKKYLSESRASVVENACSQSNRCTGASCVPTTSEDQDAYTRYQIEKSLETRQRVFNISANECPEGEGSQEQPGDPDSLGARVAKYAVETYDSWSYSQNNRHQQGYVDCSSMVARAYAHFGVRIYDTSDTSGEEYRWCERHGAVISGNNLQAGDLIFYIRSNNSNYKSIGHVDMYIGNNQKFAARSANYEQEKQVSVGPYLGNGNYFCRPSITVGGK